MVRSVVRLALNPNPPAPPLFIPFPVKYKASKKSFALSLFFKRASIAYWAGTYLSTYLTRTGTVQLALGLLKQAAIERAGR